MADFLRDRKMSELWKPHVIVRVKVGNEVVEAEVVKSNKKTVWIKLPDGKIIKRKNKRHLAWVP